MKKRALGDTGIEIAPLVFGGNVFGWTADETMSFRLLDQFTDAGFDAIDTADVYSAWVDGHSGGESETIIGDWLAANPSKRDRVKIFTKVGMELGPHKQGLSKHWIVRAVEQSLSRLKTDYIDLYFAHRFDPHTPHEETLEAFAELMDAGKIRAIGASNFSYDQLEDALRVADEQELPAYRVFQPEYSLVSRDTLEGPLLDLLTERGLGVVTYFSLASGFLSGKYRDEEDLDKHERGSRVEQYLNEGGLRIVEALDAIGERLRATPAEVAIAWIVAQPGVTAPIASATNPDQLKSLIKATKLDLDEEAMEQLDAASGY